MISRFEVEPGDVIVDRHDQKWIVLGFDFFMGGNSMGITITRIGWRGGPFAKVRHLYDRQFEQFQKVTAGA